MLQCEPVLELFSRMVLEHSIVKVLNVNGVYDYWNQLCCDTIILVRLDVVWLDIIVNGRNQDITEVDSSHDEFMKRNIPITVLEGQ